MLLDATTVYNASKQVGDCLVRCVFLEPGFPPAIHVVRKNLYDSVAENFSEPSFFELCRMLDSPSDETYLGLKPRVEYTAVAAILRSLSAKF